MIITNLLTNMVVIGLGGTVLHTTPTFEDYAKHAMLTNAQAVACAVGWPQAWIISNRVSSCWVEPHASGLTGGIEFGSRYAFGYRKGRFVGCTDNYFDADFYYSGDEKRIRATEQKWLAATNLLSLAAARRMAIGAMRSLGLTPEATNFQEPKGKQFDTTHPGENTISLPYYYFDWKSTVLPAARVGLGFSNLVVYETATIEVSGISGGISKVEIECPYLMLATPTNYLQVLGFPPGTILVRKRVAQPGEPPTYETILP